MYAAVQFCKTRNLGPDKRVVVLLADSIRNYMSKHLNEDWMKVKNLKYSLTMDS